MKTVKVRIAVAVDSEAQWHAHGDDTCSGNESREEAMALIGEGLPCVLYWLTAELPIPEAQEVAANVEASE